MTTKRPCQNTLIQGEAMCPRVATWEIIYTTAKQDFPRHERRYCDYHVKPRLGELLLQTDPQNIVWSVCQIHYD